MKQECGGVNSRFCYAEPNPGSLLRVREEFEVFPWMDYREPAVIELLPEQDAKSIRVDIPIDGNSLVAKCRYSLVFFENKGT